MNWVKGYVVATYYVDKGLIASFMILKELSDHIALISGQCFGLGCNRLILLWLSETI